MGVRYQAKHNRLDQVAAFKELRATEEAATWGYVVRAGGWIMAASAG
jgi:hypothetical protein